MKDRSVRCALWLKKQNIGIGDIVVLSANKRMDNYIPALAAFYVGATYYPWNHNDTLGKILINII